jgi:outer membrane protein assembly factor BamB
MSAPLPGKTVIVRFDEGRELPAIRVWRLSAWIAAVFSLLVGGTLLVDHFGASENDTLTSPVLKTAREQLRANPGDEALKERIRRTDLQLRQGYFRHLTLSSSGVYLLLGGAVLFVFAASRAGNLQRKPLLPETDSPGMSAERTAKLTRWSIAAGGTCIGTFLFVLSLGWSTAPPERAADSSKSALAGDHGHTADYATAEELKQNWPRFRGIDGSGCAPFTKSFEKWDAKTGAGILWKVQSPASGFSSPIVWQERVFLSGGDASKREVICLDVKTGSQVWRRSLVMERARANAGEIPQSTGYAASTMATDGRRVYVLFATGELGAFSLDGKQVWAKDMGALDNPYGHATSLATWHDRLLLQLDQGESEQSKSRLYALDGRTGAVVWQVPRKVGSSWASPVVFESAGKGQVVALAVPWAIAYGAADGAELWRIECLNGEVTPSPISAAGLVLVASPSEKLLAIRPDGRGDVAKTHVSWTTEDNVPDISTPASNGELVFALTASGVLACLDIKDGKKQWDHDFEMDCHSSPSIAGNRVYIFGQKGVAVAVEAARQFKQVFRTEMGDSFHASPAFGGDRMFVRGETNVWCLGSKGAEK